MLDKHTVVVLQVPKLNVVIYILIIQEGQSRQKCPKRVSQKISKGQSYWAFVFLTSFFGIFLAKSHMPLHGGQMGEAWGEMKSALAASQVEERQGWAPSLTGLIADAAVPVVLLLVVSKLVPTTLAVKRNENWFGRLFKWNWYVCSWWILKNFSPWICAFSFWGWERRRWGVNPWPILFFNTIFLAAVLIFSKEAKPRSSDCGGQGFPLN